MNNILDTENAPIISNKMIAHNARLNMIMSRIVTELNRQDTKWGADRIMNPQLIAVILGEEYGEVCRAILNMMKTSDVAHHAHEQNYQEELVQIAAFSIAALNSFMLQKELEASSQQIPLSVGQQKEDNETIFYEGFLSPRCFGCAVPNAKAEFYVEPNGNKVGVCTLCGSPFSTDHAEFAGMKLLDDEPGKEGW